MEEGKLIKIAPGDSVAVATLPLEKGTVREIDGEQITLLDDIPYAHKVALFDITEGTDIIRYGAPIGHATANIKRGEHIHTHNMATNLSDLLEYTYEPVGNMLHAAPSERTFNGYLRPDGRAGIRNEVWIIPTVGCINRTAQLLAQEANVRFAGRCDGVLAFPHEWGCGQSGQSLEDTRCLLRGLINNPNAGAVLVLSLGCEHNEPHEFMEFLGDIDPNRVKLLITQDCQDELETGMKVLDELTQYAAQYKRQPLGLDKLAIGLKCGGSDALSGITANPLCGRITDKVVASGGTMFLSEVPEMFGAETRLMARATDEGVFHKIVDLINDYKKHFIKYGEIIYDNPSPGNKAGGITTLEDKSLGCTQKGGTAPVVDTLRYGEQAHKKGLNLVYASGYDLITCTNIAACGATMILFTTGRGNPYGGPVPTLKIASNSGLYNRKKQWFDYNAGRIIDELSFDQAAEELLDRIIRCASGEEPAQCELFGYREICIFKDGATL